MSPALVNATSSRGSLVGRWPSAWLGFQTTPTSGAGLVHVSPGPLLESERESRRKDTSGLTSSISSKSVALSASLGSKLQARLGTNGSTLFTLTWKEQTTPSGRRFSLLRASGRRTADTESSLAPSSKAHWETPQAELDSKWRISTTEAAKRRLVSGKSRSNEMWGHLTITGGPTPVVNDSGGSTHAYAGGNHDKIALKLPGAALMAGSDPLPPRLANLTSWATPAARDWRLESATEEFNEKRWTHTRSKPLSAEVTLVGETQSGCLAETVPSGQLSPVHSCWLMGYPLTWLSCAEEAPSKTAQRNSKGLATR